MPQTKDSIKQIQKAGIDWLGNPLLQDGVLGRKTNWWIGISGLDKKRQEVQRLALGYHASNIEYERTGRNDSPFVDRLFEPVDMEGRHLAWCAAFVSHVMRQCDVEWPVYHISVYRLIEWAKANQLIVNEPLPSDIEAYLHPKVPGEDYKGHTRIITGYDKNTGRTAGVDGNVNNAVYCGYRDPRPGRVFIRPRNLTSQCLNSLVMPTKLSDLDGYKDR